MTSQQQYICPTTLRSMSHKHTNSKSPNDEGSSNISKAIGALKRNDRKQREMPTEVLKLQINGIP